MPVMNMYAEVVLPIPLKGTFTYSIPAGLSEAVLRGSRVLVPFGPRKQYTGLVWRLHRVKPARFQVRDILSVLDNTPLIDDKQMSFWEWISQYYFCSIGEVFKAALPAGLKPGSESGINSCRPKKEAFLELNPDWNNESRLNDLMDKLRRAPAQLELLTGFLRLAGYTGKEMPLPLLRKELLKKHGLSRSALQRLLQKGGNISKKM